jgi:hypothetical protein
LVVDIPGWLRGHGVIGRHYFLDVVGSNSKHSFWASDGTVDGTNLLLDDGAGPVFELDGRVIFFHDQRFGVTVIWQTDGTPAGTTPIARVHDLVCGRARQIGEHVYFSCGDARLWRTDGTAAGTIVAAEHVGGGVEPIGAAFGRILYYKSPVEPVAPELWSTDGAGDSIKIGEFGYLARSVEVDGRVFLGTHTGLWRLYENNALEQIQGASETYGLLAVDGLLVFGATIDGGDRLWRSDGTPYGLAATPLDLVDDPTPVTRVGDLVYFQSVRKNPSCPTSFPCHEVWAIPVENLHE